MAILSQLAIVIGLVLVGMRHFDNIKTGIAAATLYLLLPYTAMWTGSVTHALPGALLVWAIVFYRWPLLAGAMIGLAFGTIYYPMFLLAAVDQLLLAARPDAISDRRRRDGRDRAGAGARDHVGRTRDCSWPSLQQMFGLRLPQATESVGVVGPILAADLSLSDHRGARGIEPEHGAVAGAKEPGHAHQLFGGHDAGHAILVRAQRRTGAGLVPAAALADDIPAELGRPRGGGGGEVEDGDRGAGSIRARGSGVMRN